MKKLKKLIAMIRKIYDKPVKHETTIYLR